MRAFWSLCKQHLRLYRLTTVIWLAIIAMMAYFVAEMGRTVTSGNNMQEIMALFPDAIKRLMGDPAAYRYPVDLYIQGKWLQFMPLLAGIFGVLSAMSIMAREIDRRTADFVLTLPVRRSLVLFSRFTALALNIGLLYLGSVLLLWLGLKQVGVQGAIGNYALFSLGHYCLTLFFAAATLCLSVYLEEYTAANRYALIGVVGLYAIYIILKTVGAGSGISVISLYGLVDAETVVGHGHWPWLGILAGCALTGFSLWLSAGLMEKKQVPA